MRSRCCGTQPAASMIFACTSYSRDLSLLSITFQVFPPSCDFRFFTFSRRTIGGRFSSMMVASVKNRFP